ncbi:MAG: hypothetical protein EXQ48_04040 [Acidobacteria bacterium]|nr:hypothetical protein [Acidobacteriota bacterium]
MLRKTRVLLLLVSALVGLAFAAACGASGPEQQALANFFRASRVRDSAALANIAAVAFDPRTDGSVQEFTIVSIGAEERRPMDIKKLAAEEEAAKQAESDFSMKKRSYQNDNMEAIQRVVKAEGAKETLKGKDVEVQAAWTKWRDEQSQYSKKLSDARVKASGERGRAVASLTAPGREDVDVSAMDVELVTKLVTINAQVKDPGGQTAPKTLVLTMQHAIGKKLGGESQEGHWMITAIK